MVFISSNVSTEATLHVHICHDFNRHENQRWLKAHEISSLSTPFLDMMSNIFHDFTAKKKSSVKSSICVWVHMNTQSYYSLPDWVFYSFFSYASEMRIRLTVYQTRLCGHKATVSVLEVLHLLQSLVSSWRGQFRQLRHQLPRCILIRAVTADKLISDKYRHCLYGTENFK